jgi:hypothetical protein
MGFTRTSVVYATPDLTLGTANASGSVASAIRSDSTVLTYDTTDPTNIGAQDSPSPGTSSTAARRDHVHGGTAVFSAATQAEMEAASSTTTTVTPGRTVYHPGVAKAWLQFHHATAIDSSYNITSVANTATGHYTITIDTNFSSADYSCATLSNYDRIITANSSTAATAGLFYIYCSSFSGSSLDLPSTTVGSARLVWFGDQ